MATNANEEIKIEAPKETVEMASTPTPAPVAPVTPAVSWQDAQANAVEVSKRTNAEVVTSPAPATPAPVAWQPTVQAPTDYKWNPETKVYDMQAQTPAPATPAPKAETPKQVKTEAPVDYNVSTGREADIQKNLSDITATNPALTQDRAKFDAAFGYSTADVGKKALLDSFFDSKRVKSQDDFLGILNSGRTVSEDLKGSPEYKMAKSRFDAVQNYKSFTVPQFSSAIANGSLIPGSQAYKDLMSNPESASNVRKAQALNAINKKPASDEGKRESVMNEIKATTFGQAVADGFIDPKEADALMTTDEIKAQQAKIEPLKDKYDALKADYDNIETDTKKEFEASGKSRAYVNAKISERRKNQYRDLSVLESQYNNAVGTLSDMKKAQAEILSFNKELWSAERGFEKQKELATFQNSLKSEGIETQIIKDEATGKQMLIDSKTGKVISSYETGAKPGSGTNLQQIKQTDELGRETVVGFFDPATGKSTYYGAGGQVSGGAGGTPVSFGWASSGFSGQGWMRTDRHNNPAAFTTDIAKQAGLVEGVDYSVGDAFGGGKFHTARLLGDPVDTTIRVIDNIGFKTKSGANRWTYTDKLGLNNASWSKMDKNQKTAAIYKMYQNEGWSGELFGNWPSVTETEPATAGFDPKKSALYENVLKWDAKTLAAKGYATRESRDAIVKEAMDWASSGGETAKDRAEKAKISKSDVIDRIDKFNASQTSKDYKLGKPNIDKVMKNAEADTAASDIALIFGFMKQQDPQSTVREGEFATAQNSGGVPDAVRNAYNKAMSGQRLQPAQREDFVKTSISAFKSQLSAYNEEVRNARDVAEKLWIDTSAFPKEETFSRKFKDGTAVEYDALGKYRYKAKDGKWSGWTDEGTPIKTEAPKKSALERARELRNK